MEVKFFRKEKAYSDPKMNGKSKIRFGFGFILIGLFIYFAEQIGFTEFHSGGTMTASGKILFLLVDLLYITIGKWITMSIFSGIGILFLISGIKEINNAN